MSNTDLVIITDKTFEVVQSAVNKMVGLIRPTFGPASNKVIISKVLNKEVIDDGVKIAQNFELPDPAENAIVNLIREVASRTNDRVGDGTTGSLLMLQGIIEEVGKRRKVDGRKVELELRKGLDEVRAELKKSARQIRTKDELKKVAMVAFDNEPIAEIIASLYFKLGKQAIITIDRSQTMETTAELNEGVKLDTGYISPYMINNPERMETVFEKPYILITDYRITENSDLMPIMEKMATAGKLPLVIFAENVEQQALATLVINEPQVMNPQTRKLGTFPSVAVGLPKVDHRTVMLEDLALLTGAKMFTVDKGDKLQDATLEDLGRCERFICSKDSSIIVGPKGKKSTVNSAVAAIKSAIENEKKESEKDNLKYRLGMFTNTLATIKVGALTDNERKSLKEKVEDAVHAVKSAYNSGVVCGAGRALAQIRTSSPILNEALKYPSRQLMENMGLPDDLGLDKDHVMNVVTGKVGPFMSVGVVDSADALLAGVESAVSIASTLVTSSGMIVEAPKKPKIVD